MINEFITNDPVSKKKGKKAIIKIGIEWIFLSFTNNKKFVGIIS